ncbi:DMT family transporter [Tropicimonas sp. IMCC6043]|uniref:DMT family transporter n=1 Tax=Tropicimonas sp. IMCC6043 TaxID=2510645 RepID=UPI00101DED8A|nr:DMT family transporter [Tropicimonas sp. IMCC6043]RYH10410.1 DMT family transporter [Tropicimonas sp. IMCC6043]
MNNLHGALLMILSMGMFAFQDLFIKKASATLPPGAILTAMGCLGALIFAGFVRARRQSLLPRELFRRAMLLRNAGEVVGAFAFISALALADLAAVSAIIQALPLAVTLMAALFLGEPVGWRRWSAISVGFLGVLLIVRPGTHGFEPATLLAVVAVLALGLRDLATRIAPPAMSSAQIGQWGYLMMLVAGLTMTLTADTATLPSAPLASYGLLTIAILVGVAGYYTIIQAIRISEISAVAPFRYARIVFALLLAVFVLGERPDSFTLAGAALIVASGLYALARERALFSGARQG